MCEVKKNLYSFPLKIYQKNARKTSAQFVKSQNFSNVLILMFSGENRIHFDFSANSGHRKYSIDGINFAIFCIIPEGIKIYPY